MPDEVGDPARAARDAVRADPGLLARYRVEHGGSDATAALDRAEEPARPGADGTASPFAGLEEARRRVFRPGATAADRAAWQALDAARRVELARVDAAARRATAAAAPSVAAPEAVALEAVGRSGRRRRRLLLGVAVVLALVVGAAGVRQAVRSGPSGPDGRWVRPPAVAGTTLITMTNQLDPLGPPGTSAARTSPEDPPLDPKGGAVALGLRCRGAGRVRIDLSSEEVWRFDCRADERTFTRVSPGAHPAKLIAFVRTTGRARWALRIVTRPVPRPASSTARPAR